MFNFPSLLLIGVYLIYHLPEKNVKVLNKINRGSNPTVIGYRTPSKRRPAKELVNVDCLKWAEAALSRQ